MFEAADRLALLAAVLNTRFVVVVINLPGKLLRVALLHAFAGKQHSTTLQLVSCLCEAAGVAACYGSACSWAYQISEEEQHDGLPVSVCHWLLVWKYWINQEDALFNVLDFLFCQVTFPAVTSALTYPAIIYGNYDDPSWTALP